MADAAGTQFKDTFEILTGIYEVWDKIDDTSRARLSDIMAGQRGMASLSSVMQNMDDVINAYNDAMNSDGVAAEANARAMDTIEKKAQQLKVAFEELSMTVVNSDFAKGVVDLATTVVSAIDTVVSHLGILSTALATISVTSIFKSGLIKDFDKFKTFASMIPSVLKNLEAIKASREASMLPMGESLFGSMASAAGLSTTAVLTAGLAGVTAALAAGAAAWHLYQQHLEKIAEAADAAAAHMQSTRTEIEGYKDEINQLKTGLDSGSMSDEEAYAARSRLAEIQETLIENYGKEAEGINLIGDAASTSAAKLDQLTEAEARRALDTSSDSGKGFERAIKKMTKDHSYTVSFDWLPDMGDSGKAMAEQIQQLADQFDNIGFNQGIDKAWTLKIDGDTTDAAAALNSLYDIILEYEDEVDNLGGSITLADIKDNVKSNLDALESDIAEYGDRYQEAMMNSLVLDEDANTAYQAIDGYIDNLVEGVKNGDWTAVSEALNSLDAFDLSNVKDNNLKTFLQRMIDDATDEDYEVMVNLNLKFPNDARQKERAQHAIAAFLDDDGKLNSALLGSVGLDPSAGTDAQVRAYSTLSSIAESLGTDVGSLVAKMIELGLVEPQVAEATDEVTEAVKTLDERIESIQSAYSTLKTVLTEMMSGGVSGETALGVMKELNEAGENLSDYFTVENGKLKLNTKAYREYAQSQSETQEYLEGLYKLRDSYEMDSKDPLFAKTGEPQQKLKDIEAEIAIVEQVLREATSLTEQFFSMYDEGTSSLSTIEDISKALSSGGASRSQMLEWMQDFPDLAKYYDATTNSIQDQDAALRSIVASKYNSFLEEINNEISTNKDLTAEDVKQLYAMAEAYREAAELALSTNKAMTLLGDAGKELNVITEEYASTVRGQLERLWNSDVFADARADLEELAETTGVTAQDILDLADNNEYLQYMLNESGVSAGLLASVFQELSTVGSSAFGSITADVLNLNRALTEMDKPLQQAIKALDDYDAAMGLGDYDDTFDRYQKAYSDLGEMFENGEYGKDFRRTIELLYGEGHGADGVKELYDWYKKIGTIFSEDDNGLGMLTTLAENQSLLDGLNSYANEEYGWFIDPEEISVIADRLGITEGALSACIEGMNMFGEVTNWNIPAAIDAIKNMDMAVQDLDGTTQVSEDSLRSMLDTLGLEGWEIDQFIDKIQSTGEIKLVAADDSAWDAYTKIYDSMTKLTGEPWTLDLESTNVDYVENQLSMLQKYRDSLVNEDGTIDADFKESYDSATTLITLLQGQLDLLRRDNAIEIDVGDLKEANDGVSGLVDAMLHYQEVASAIQQGVLGGDTGQLQSAREALEGYLSDLDKIPDEVKTRFGLETEEDVQNLLDGIADGTIRVTDEENFSAEFQEILTNGETDLTLNVQLDEDSYAGVQEQLEELQKPIEIPVTFTTNGEAPGAGDAKDASGTVNIATNVTGQKDVQSLQDAIDKLGNKTVKIGAKVIGQSALDALRSSINSLSSRTVTITTNYVTRYSTTGRTSSSSTGTTGSYSSYGANGRGITGRTESLLANGTAHASGSALARGNWGISRTTVALTGELGPEIVVDPDSGSWQTVGDQGAGFVKIKKGSIVFNHKQTEALLKYGKVAGRGRVMVNGSAYASGTALAGGSQIPTTNPATGKSYTNSYTSSKSSSTAASTAAAAASTAAQAASTAADAADTLDWIAVLIDRISRRAELLGKTATSTFKNMATRAEALAGQMEEITKEINAQAVAYEAYMKAANDVGLSDYYVDLVQNGGLSIEAISDETLKTKIEKYQEYYEKALDAKAATADLSEELAQHYQDAFDLIATDYENAIGRMEHESNMLEKRIELAEATGEAVDSAVYTRMRKNAEERQALYEQEVEDLKASLQRALDSNEIDIYSEAWHEMTSRIEEAEEAAVDMAIAAANAAQDWLETLDKIEERYSLILGLIQSRATVMETTIQRVEANGYVASTRFYENLINNYQQQAYSIVAEQDRLKSELEAAVKQGLVEVNDDEWLQAMTKINQKSEEYASTLLKIAEYQKQIQQINWNQFDDTLNYIQDINDEAEFLINLLESNNDLFTGDKVAASIKNTFGAGSEYYSSITNEGQAILGLRAEEYMTYMKMAEKYAAERAKIESQLASDPYNKDLLDRRMDLLAAQREAISNTYDERDAIKSLVKDGIESQLNVLKTLIDEYEDAMDTAKSLYDYQQKVEEQSKKISNLQKQLNAYQGDDSEETRKTIQQLKNDLIEAERDLEETQYDQYISDQKKLLDKLYDEYELNINSRLDDIDALIAEVIRNVESGASEIWGTINGAADEVGYEITEQTTTIWNALTTVGDGIDSMSDAVTTAVNNAARYIAEMYTQAASQEKAENILAQMKANSEAWWSADAEEKTRLHNENEDLAQQYQAITGETLNYTASSGRWYGDQGTTYTVSAGSTKSTEEAKAAAKSQIQYIVDKMYKNSKEWTPDEAGKIKANENEKLARQLENILGTSVTKKNDGYWYINGKKLFWEIYPPTEYHTGGVVGGGTLGQRERYAKLLDGEVVLTEEQLKKLVPSTAGVSDLSGLLRNGLSAASATYDKNSHPNVISMEVTLPGVKNYEEFWNQATHDPRVSKFIQAESTDRLAGKSSLAKNKIQW